MNMRKKIRPNLKRLSNEEFNALSTVRIKPQGRLDESEYREMWNYNPPKEEPPKE